MPEKLQSSKAWLEIVLSNEAALAMARKHKMSANSPVSGPGAPLEGPGLRVVGLSWSYPPLDLEIREASGVQHLRPQVFLLAAWRLIDLLSPLLTGHRPLAPTELCGI
jgi:hypothetical protein